jgi:hypothetical protein
VARVGELNQVRHHAVLAHGLAVQAIRARGKAGTKVGPAENINIAVPLIESAEHIQAAQNATREANAPFLTVILEGKYTDAYLKEAGKDAPKFTDEDLKVIAAPLDFVGIHVYKPDFYVLASAQAPGWRAVPFAKAHPTMFNRLLSFGPEALYWAPKFVQSLWNAREICANGPRLTIALPQSCAATAAGRSVRLFDVEKEHIKGVLESTRWRIRGVGGAAAQLGLKATTLETRMAKLGLQRPRL